MAEKPALERVSFSPGEFAALFGKQQTWGYRQIYAGKVKAITEYGRIQIPAAEVERILASAGRYEGMPKKPAKTKAELQSMKPEIQSAWKVMVQQRREGKRAAGRKPKVTAPRAGKQATAREAALARLTSRGSRPAR